MRHVLELSSASLRHLKIAKRVRIASINHEWEPSTGVILLMAHRGMYLCYIYMFWRCDRDVLPKNYIIELPRVMRYFLDYPVEKQRI